MSKSTAPASVVGGLFGLRNWEIDSPSSFDVGKWDRFDWEFILENYPKIQNAAVRMRDRGVDAREAFFALSGKEVTGTGPLANAWRAALKTDAWRKAIKECSTKQDKAIWLQSMLAKMEQDLDVKDTQEASFTRTDASGNEQDLADLPVITDEDKVAQVIEESGEDAEEATAIALLAGSLSGNLDIDVPQEFNDQILMLAGNLDMELFASLLGGCSRVVRGVSRRTHGGTEEMTGYGLSGWCDKVVAQDQMAVARGDLQAMVKLAEDELSVKKYDSNLPLGKGPVVVLRDETASMKYGGGTRHKQALAFEVALAQVFNDDGRDLVTVAWGVAETRTHVWGDEDYDLGRHLSSFLFAGATRPYQGLLRGMKVANEYVDGTDILIITDGRIDSDDVRKIQHDGHIQSKFEEFRASGGRIWAVIVGGDGADTWKQALPFADGVVSIGDISTSESAILDVVAGMADRDYGSSKNRKREVW